MTETPSLGSLELSQRAGGFLRRRANCYLEAPGDIVVPRSLIGTLRLRAGDEIWGVIGKGGNRGRGQQQGQRSELQSVDRVNGRAPDTLADRPDFERLRVTQPVRPLTLAEPSQREPTRSIARAIDLFCPFGFGQRALIVAPAKAGKTTVLQSVAEGVAKNYPTTMLLILLVDERPEEVTEMEACGYGEVIASSFDFPPQRHIAVAEMTLERARRQVELGLDVVLILDSITRLARAYNAAESGNSRTLSGGLGANSMEHPKRFFGSARTIDPAQGGGSLTIIATALIDTGSRMDQVIFEEFKGTGNSELVLSRELAERRLYPAIDLAASGTRREELLLSPADLARTHEFRQHVSRLPAAQALDRARLLLG